MYRSSHSKRLHQPPQTFQKETVVYSNHASTFIHSLNTLLWYKRRNYYYVYSFLSLRSSAAHSCLSPKRDPPLWFPHHPSIGVPLAVTPSAHHQRTGDRHRRRRRRSLKRRSPCTRLISFRLICLSFHSSFPSRRSFLDLLYTAPQPACHPMPIASLILRHRSRSQPVRIPCRFLAAGRSLFEEVFVKLSARKPISLC